jgi:hypothetical protein
MTCVSYRIDFVQLAFNDLLASRPPSGLRWTESSVKQCLHLIKIISYKNKLRKYIDNYIKDENQCSRVSLRRGSLVPHPQQAVGRGGGSSSGGFDVNSSYKLHAQSA